MNCKSDCIYYRHLEYNKKIYCDMHGKAMSEISPETFINCKNYKTLKDVQKSLDKL